MIDKGTFVLGGAVRISNQTIETKSFGISEKSKDNTVLGISINHNYSKSEHIKSNITGFGIFAEKHKEIGKKTAIYLGFNGLYVFGKSSFEVFSDKFDSTQTNTFSLSLSPGFTYFISKKIALKASVGSLRFNFLEIEDKFRQTESTSQGFDFDFDLSNISLGVSFYL